MPTKTAWPAAVEGVATMTDVTASSEYSHVLIGRGMCPTLRAPPKGRHP